MTGIKFAVPAVETRRTAGIIALLWAALLLMMPGGALAASKDAINCDIQKGPCSLELSGAVMTLEITPRPVKAMEDLTFRVTLPEAPKGDAPFIDLGMPGMNMGKNRVSLGKTENGTYEGKGVIVRCPSGKTIWKARVTVPGTGEAGFIFDVVY